MLLLSYLLLLHYHVRQAYSDITDEVKMNFDGVIAAYGDFNSDQTTDIFVITNEWKSVEVFGWDVAKQSFYKMKEAKIGVSSDEKIVGMVFADFNGDGCGDVLLSTKKKQEKDKNIYVQIYHGDSISLEPAKISPMKMQDQPTILDVNGDLLPDIFGTEPDGTRTYWIAIPESNGVSLHYAKEPDPYSTTQVSIPQSNAFIDVTGDLYPDLIIKSQPTNGSDIPKKPVMFEVWEQKSGSSNITLSHSFELDDVSHTGRVSYVDIDGDQYTDVIVPACLTDDCSKSVLYAQNGKDAPFSNGKWYVLLDNDHHEWQFSKDDMQPGATFPIQLIFGDFTMDGMVDAITLFEIKGKGKESKFVAKLVNTLCKKNEKDTGCRGKNTLKVSNMETVYENPMSVSLLDIYENGALDFVVTYRNKINENKFYTKAYKSDVLEDAFLKVSVLSGLCYKECICHKGKTRHSAIQIGSMVNIDTTNTDGDQMLRKAGQLYQTGYFALQLPYIVFGLGKSPNFVDEIEVGIPKGSHRLKRHRSWSSIIPNAQVIVIPYPKDDPGDWVTKLLVTPSKMLLQTGGVLLGTMLLIAALILILHIKEKREDEEEKRKEAHKFHFDAL